MVFMLHAYVVGRVQGVGFRYFALHTAESFGGITGFVRNEYDGSVEIVAEGKKEILRLFLDKIKQGPTYGHVSDVTVNWAEIEKRKYKNFTITY